MFLVRLKPPEMQIDNYLAFIVRMSPLTLLGISIFSKVLVVFFVRGHSF